MKTKYLSLLFLAICVLFGTVSQASEPTLVWEQDLNRAIAIAKSTGRLVFVHFYGDNCPPCRAMDSTVFPNPRVIGELNRNFVAVKADLSVQSQLAKQFDIKAIPTDIILDGDGKTLHRRQGGISADRFVQYLTYLQGMASKPYSSVSPVTPPAAPVISQPVQSTQPAPTAGNSGVLHDPFTRQPVTGPVATSNPISQNVASTPTSSAAGNTAQPSAPVFTSVPPSQQTQPSSAPLVQMQVAQSPTPIAAKQEPVAAAPVQPAPAATVAQAPIAQVPPASPSVFDMIQSIPPAQPVVAASPSTQSAPVQAAPVQSAPAPNAQPAFAAAPAPHATPAFAAAPAPHTSVAASPSATESAASTERSNPIRPEQAATLSATNTNTASQPVVSPAVPSAALAAQVDCADNVTLPTVELPLGLEGFCPVVLGKNERWVPGNPAFYAMYRGQVYRFSSEKAMEEFQKAPLSYAPVAMGEDIVLMVERNKKSHGTRKFGVWYEGRVYLFSCQESLDMFSAKPAYYAEIAQKYETAFMSPIDSVQR